MHGSTKIADTEYELARAVRLPGTPPRTCDVCGKKSKRTYALRTPGGRHVATTCSHECAEARVTELQLRHDPLEVLRRMIADGRLKPEDALVVDVEMSLHWPEPTTQPWVTPHVENRPYVPVVVKDREPGMEGPDDDR